MILWRWILWLLLIALLAALGWQVLAIDPGYVLLRFHSWQLQATVVGLGLLLLVLVVALIIIWKLLRWPFGMVAHRHQRISRKRFSEGLLALVEGRHSKAQRALARAARFGPLKGPALLAEAEAAWRRGEYKRAHEVLDEATRHAADATQVLRARMLRREGHPEEALALLVPAAEVARLPPAAWVELVKVALLTGRVDRARAALEPLRSSAALGTSAFARIEAQVLAAAIDQAADGASLNALWADLSRAQRRPAEVVAAYACKAARYGLGLAAMGEIESALARGWAAVLVTSWAKLGEEHLEHRLELARKWLDAHPNDVVLLATLGRLCLLDGQLAQAREYLERSVGLDESALAWEVLGEVLLKQQHAEQAARCFRNALRAQRQDVTEALISAGRMPTRPLAVEVRSELGVPRLPE